MANRTQIHKKASSHFTPTPATGMFQPRPFAEPVQPETATPEVQTKVELRNLESDRLRYASRSHILTPKKRNRVSVMNANVNC